MGVEGGMKCVKYLIFLFNFIFWLCGLALIVVGALVQVSLHETLVISDATSSGAPILIIVVGVVIFLISFFGCCGAWKENYCMITTFSVLLGLIIVVEIAAAIAGYVYRDKLSEVVQDSLTDIISKYNSSSPDLQDLVDKMQQKFQCCGSNSSSDWRNFAPDGKSVPDSCCVTVSLNCGRGAMSDGSIVFQTGCHDTVELMLEENLLWVIIAAVVIAILQLLGIVFACLLMRGIRSGYEVM